MGALATGSAGRGHHATTAGQIPCEEAPIHCDARAPTDAGRPARGKAGGLRPVVSLRRAAASAVADVTRGPQAGLWHLVLCRNLAISLTEDADRRLWRRLADVPAPGGFVVTGRAEPRQNVLVRLDHCLYQKPWAA